MSPETSQLQLISERSQYEFILTNYATSTTFFTLLVSVSVLGYAYWRMSRRHMYALAENIPGPKGLPILGNALMFRGSSYGIFILNFLYLILKKKLN